MRIEAKRNSVLTWLADETFTTKKILERVTGLQRNAVHKTLISMVRDDLIEMHEMSWLDFHFRVFALTPHGAAFIGRPGAHFQSGRIGESTIPHLLDVQLVRLQAQEIGWTGWIPERSLRMAAEEEKRGKKDEDKRLWLKVPDAVGLPPQGQGAVAIEVERTIKTKKSYEVVVGQYLQMIKRGAIERVIYLTRTERVAKALSATFKRITSVPIGGQRFDLGPEHYARFDFHALTSPETWAGGANITTTE